MTAQQYRVGVVGATGAVGEVMLATLSERQFPVSEVRALASSRSAGGEVDFGRKQLVVEDLASFDFSQLDIALFSAGGSVSREFGPKAAAAGCTVIDNSSEFRYDDDVPLVVSEVNPHALADFRTRNIIANPNCSTMQLVVALAPIHREVGIERINIATYQSVSGSGKSGLEELAKQTAELLNFKPATRQVYPDQIAFNAIPHIDAFQDNGYTKEEMKLVWETRKILEDDAIEVNPTAVRVPVFYGHAEAVHLELGQPLTPDQARELLEKAPGVTVLDQREAGGYPTQATHASGKDDVFVGRIRTDISHPNGLNLWVVSDNIRKGAALNAVQVAEVLVNDYL